MLRKQFLAIPRLAIPVVLVAVMSVTGVFAQEDSVEPVVPDGTVRLTPVTEWTLIEPASVAAETKSAGAPVIIREQTVYIPFDKLRDTFEKHGRGVFLPYEEFRQLWDAAQAKPVEPPKPQPVPVPFMISETVHEAQVADEIVQVTARLKIDLLAEGWHEVPIRLNNVAITEATIGDAPARLLGNPQQGYRLLIEAATPGAVEVELKYARTIEKSPGRNGVSFEVPQTPISRWVVRIPESGVKVDFYPLIAASEEPDGESGTKVLAFVGAAPTVRIGWTPRAEGATGLESLTSVQLEQRVTLDEGVLRTQAILDYTISRAEIDRLSIEVPSDQRVLSIFDPNVRTWSVNQGDETQTIQVELFQPASDRQRIVLGLERLLEADDKSVEIPTIRAVGAGRQQGVLGISVSNTLTTDTARAVGLMQMDTAELPQTMRGAHWLYAYRLASPTYHLTLSVERVQPQVTSDSQVTMLLTADRLNLTKETVFTIERAGVFQLLLDIPDGYEIQNVAGFQRSSDVQPVSVNTWHVSHIPDEPAMRRLTVDLTAKAMGKVGLQIDLTKRLDDADLRSPTGNAVDFTIPVPVVARDFVIRRDAKVLVSVPEHFRINKAEPTSMQTVPVEQLRSEWRGRWIGLAGQLGFVLGQTNATLDLQIERRKPQITIRQFQLVEIEDGVAKYTSRFYYTILHSGVRSLRVDVPAEISSRVRNRTQAIRDAVILPPPADVEEGMVAWEFSGGSELSGEGMFELYWENELGQLQIGEPLTVSVPRLVPREVDRVFGHIAITKAQTIDLGDSPENRGLRPVDPRIDIPERDRMDNVAAAFEFFDNWTLNLIATRYELEEVKRTSIEAGLVRAVMVNNSTTLSVQALYQIRSVQQRLTIAMPSGATFDLAPTINGSTVTLERDSTGDAALHYIPLTSTNPEQSFLLELRYSQPFPDGRILLPTFPTEPAVQEMFVAVYVPNDRVLRRFSGTWTPLFEMTANWEFMNFQRMTTVNRPAVENLIGMMMSATNTPASTSRPFATEGQAHLFSTLQPGDSGDAILKVSTRKQSHFYGFVFGVLVVWVIAITPFGWHYRLASIAIVAAGMMALNIFNPMNAMLLGSFDRGFPAELWYTAMLAVIIWVLMSCIACAKRCTRHAPVEQPVAQPQENKEGGTSHE